MRKLISATMMAVLLTGFGFSLSGCSDESSTKSQTTTSTPNGKTVETQEIKVKQSGDNPPPPTKTP